MPKGSEHTTMVCAFPTRDEIDTTWQLGAIEMFGDHQLEAFHRLCEGGLWSTARTPSKTGYHAAHVVHPPRHNSSIS